MPTLQGSFKTLYSYVFFCVVFTYVIAKGVSFLFRDSTSKVIEFQICCFGFVFTCTFFFLGDLFRWLHDSCYCLRTEKYAKVAA